MKYELELKTDKNALLSRKSEKNQRTFYYRGLVSGNRIDKKILIGREKFEELRRLWENEQVC